MSKSPVTRLADRLEDRVEDGVQDLKRSADDLAADTQKALASTAKSLARTSRALLAQVRKDGRKARRTMVKEVREHPFATAAVVLSVVALAGVLMSRRAH